MKNPLRLVSKYRIAIAVWFRPYVNRIMEQKVAVAAAILLATLPWRGLVTHLLHGASHGH